MESSRFQLPAKVAGLKGETLTVRAWGVAAGEAFSAGQVVCELEGDEANVSLEAGEAGVMGRVLAGVGVTMGLGAVVAEYTPNTAEGSGVRGQGAVKADAVTGVNPVKAGESVHDAAPVAKVKDAASGGMQGRDAPATKGGHGNAAGVVVLGMPQASNSMEEGTVVKWHVKVGDRVAAGQVIYEVETDKATVDVESPGAGRLARIVADVGAVVAVKGAVGYLAESDADVEAYLGEGAGGRGQGSGAGGSEALRHLGTEGNAEGEVVASGGVAVDGAGGGDGGGEGGEGGGEGGKRLLTPFKKASDPFVSAGAVVAGRVKASPAARKFASALGVSLAGVGGGSGPGGRVLSTDVERAAKAGVGRGPSGTTEQGRDAPATGGGRLAGAGAGGVGVAGAGGTVRRAMSKMRRAIAQNLQVSKSTVPHFYLRESIEADGLLAFVKAQKASTGCTVNDVVLLAVGRTVGEFGAFRSRVEGTDVVEWPGANIGVAVSVADGGGGLVVPVVMGVEKHSLASLAAESKRVVEAARGGKLENVGKGVFTISNMGMLGVEEFAAIINPPESGILAIGGAREAVVVKGGAIKAAKVMRVTLSVDHRVVDGALAAAWMASLKAKLEEPSSLGK